MTDTDKLIAAVKAGKEGYIVEALAAKVHIIGHEYAGWVRAAHSNNDMNAAHRLHDALLPGWVVENLGNAVIDGTGGWNVRIVAPDYLETFAHATANAGTPARAWLLAILRAVKAQEGE